MTRRVRYRIGDGENTALAEAMEDGTDGMVSFRESMTPMLRGISRNVYLERGDEIVLRMTQE